MPLAGGQQTQLLQRMYDRQHLVTLAHTTASVLRPGTTTSGDDRHRSRAKTTAMETKTTLPTKKLSRALQQVESAQTEFTRRYPGDSGARQPVHTVYGGAQLYSADTTRKLGQLALRAMSSYAPDADSFARALAIPPELADTVYSRVQDKLQREAVEDFRIDFEDGYGFRSDAEEDGHAATAAAQVALAHKNGSLPPFIGLRIKAFTSELFRRSVRTLDLFVTQLVQAGGLPPNLIVTLPKVTSCAHVEVLAELLQTLEDKLTLPPQALRLEIMVETPQSLLDAKGRSMLPQLLDAAGGRLQGAHFGAYDYTASCDITAAHQSLRHPACDLARQLMKVAFAGTGVALSDGATNILPVGPHRSPASEEQRQQNQASVHAAWRLHADDVQHALQSGFYQGWDLHPAQLPSRYGAVYSFFLQSLRPASDRLRNFIDRAAQATLLGEVFDDAASGQGLLNFFLRGLACGAVSEAEVLATGLSLDELRTRSFAQILHGRRAASPTPAASPR